MSLAKKIPLISFLILTVFFSALLGYTLFVILWARWLVDAIQISLDEIEIYQNSSQIKFYLTIKNPSNAHLKILYIRVYVYVMFNETYLIAERNFGYHQSPLDLPGNAKLDWSFSVTLKEEYSIFLSNSTLLSLSMRLDLQTPYYYKPVVVYFEGIGVSNNV